MSKYPNLSEKDSIIMQILWDNGEQSSSQILEKIEGKLDWSRQTVRTYLKRLMDKGLVGAKEEKKRVYNYYALVSKEEYANDKASSFYSKYYKNLSHMVAGIIKMEDVSDDELDNLEEMIKELRK